jgi:hypothetical protein
MEPPNDDKVIPQFAQPAVADDDLLGVRHCLSVCGLVTPLQQDMIIAEGFTEIRLFPKLCDKDVHEMIKAINTPPIRPGLAPNEIIAIDNVTKQEIYAAPLEGAPYRRDNSTVWGLLRSFTIATPAWEWIKQLEREEMAVRECNCCVHITTGRTNVKPV